MLCVNKAAGLFDSILIKKKLLKVGNDKYLNKVMGVEPRLAIKLNK